MKPSRIFVYIDVFRKYYARYSGKTCTHAFVSGELMGAKWVEILRVTPEVLTEHDPLEAA